MNQRSCDECSEDYVEDIFYCTDNEEEEICIFCCTCDRCIQFE